ncbi:hypothetical protein HMF8227_01428 [Saliniradius amylolyticus]|uniref:DUF3466 family protein n=1 Tax=Saliniradius amylolyticus TaxID=2183582 RepID=A0A2S2E2P1_9ALTE|nr:DUF3466 family protein [Saliniradius amylolyticus]AWL11903.1 hypothetical protein HMF8227_01428 [Saliniradius amylolyticus]
MTRTKLFALSALTLALTSNTAQAAVYEISELASNEQGVQSVSVAIGEQGGVVSQVQFPFNPPIDIELLDLENNEALREQLNDPDAVAQGNISDEDLVILYNVLSGSDSPLTQKLGEVQSYIGDANGATEVTGFDQASTAFDGLTRSVNTLVYDINALGNAVGTGTAPYYKVNYTNDEGEQLTYLVRDFNQRGFVYLNDQVLPLLPPEDTLGGRSAARGIADNLWVAGSVSTEAPETLAGQVSNCEDPEERGDQPVELCLQSVRNANSSNFQMRAALWKISNDGQIESLETFPLAFEPDEDSTTTFNSQANDVNSQGVGVGTAQNRVPHLNDRIRTMPAVFIDGQTNSLLLDKEDYTSGMAAGINDNGLVTGYGVRFVNGFERSKFFVYDINSETLTFPDDFFPGSSSLPRDINNNNVIVGDGEVDTVTGNGAVRRRNGFIYDHDSGSFQNLNDLIACDAPYTIVQANGINDNGEIAATAVVEKPKRNIAGEIEQDEQGNDIIESTVIAVKLNPVPGGDIEDCSDSEEKFERQAGGLSWLLLGMLGLIGWRRYRG